MQTQKNTFFFCKERAVSSSSFCWLDPEQKDSQLWTFLSWFIRYDYGITIVLSKWVLWWNCCLSGVMIIYVLCGNVRSGNQIVWSIEHLPVSKNRIEIWILQHAAILVSRIFFVPRASLGQEFFLFIVADRVSTNLGVPIQFSTGN